MDLSRPLAVVTPTLDAAVLQVLAATTASVTGNRVARLTDVGSREGVRRVLHRLVDQGIVLAEEHDRATLYTLNRDHVSAEFVLGLTRVRTTIIDRISQALDSWAPSPLHASLFGSFARGEAGPSSDIDVLVVTDDATNDDASPSLHNQHGLVSDIRRWTGNDAQLVSVTPATLRRMIADSDPLVDSWRAEHVHLAGERLLDLLRAIR